MISKKAILRSVIKVLKMHTQLLYKTKAISQLSVILSHFVFFDQQYKPIFMPLLYIYNTNNQEIRNKKKQVQSRHI